MNPTFQQVYDEREEEHRELMVLVDGVAALVVIVPSLPPARFEKLTRIKTRPVRGPRAACVPGVRWQT